MKSLKLWELDRNPESLLLVHVREHSGIMLVSPARAPTGAETYK